MSRVFELVRAVGTTLILGVAMAAHGGGGLTGVATEMTTMANHLELLKVASDGAVTASNVVQQRMLQIQQYQTQLQNIARLPSLPGSLGGDVLKAYNSLNAYKGALANLQGSLSLQSSMIEQRLTEARLSGKDWPAYLQGVSRDVAAHKDRAVSRLKYEESVINQVKADYDFARDLQSSIPQTEGVHQSVQMLNTQMNRVITQNAKLLEVVSAQIGTAAEADARRAVDRTQQAADLDAIRQRQQAIEARQRAFGGLQ
jgi:conjugal transfer/entry exclusion protein